MLKYLRRVSSEEKDLVEAVRSLRYGEMYGVEILDLPANEAVEVSPAEWGLLHFIRSGNNPIDILTVHNGQPTLAEQDLKIGSFRCRKKVKFPTSSDEG